MAVEASPDARVFSPGYNGIEDNDARTQFLTGRAGMYLMGTWLVARARKQSPGFEQKLGCFPFPSVTDGCGDASTVVGGVNCGFAVSTACKRQDDAVELLRFLTDARVATEWCRIGRIPAVRVSEEDLLQLPEPARKALALLRNAKHLQPYYDQYLPPRLAEVHKNTTQELFAGTMTPDEAAQRMEQCACELEK